MTIADMAQIFVAVGTIAVAVLAIWGEWVRHKLACPKLRLALLDPDGMVTHRLDGKKGRYYKLRVWNDRKWSPARNVRVNLKSIFKPSADGTLTPQPLSGPLQLTWQWIVPQYPTLGAGEEICTFANLLQGELFELSPYIKPNNFVGFLRANERMVIEVAVVSDTAESEPLFLDLSWNGQWSDDTIAMRTNMVIKQTRRIETS
jgi:hypothetical protein